MKDSTLRTLLLESSQGNHEAFEQLYNELKIPVYTVICRIVQNKTVAEDVMQDVFLKLNNLPPTTVNNPRAWIFKTARNAAIDELRKKHNTDCELTDDCNALRNHEHWLDFRIDLEKAIKKLSAEQREILTLHLNAQLGFQQIADITGRSLATVYRIYRKAINTLKSELNGGQQT